MARADISIAHDREKSMKALLLCAGLLLGGCEKAAQNMYDQPRYKPLAPSALFADGASARTPPPATVAFSIGPFAGPSSGRVGTDAAAARSAALSASSQPYPLDMALLERGRNRYTIYCAPCHSPVGDGDGMVPRRGFPSPPTYHSARLRAAPDRHFFDVISDGYGAMYPLADRIEPEDRWAIVAYIRALQLSQYARAQELPSDTLSTLPARRQTP
jgi:mono/diheme cytochrome c family protein